MENLWEKTAEDEITVKMNHSQFALWLTITGKFRPFGKEHIVFGKFEDWNSAMDYMESNTTFHNNQIVTENDIQKLVDNADKVTLKNT